MKRSIISHLFIIAILVLMLILWPNRVIANDVNTQAKVIEFEDKNLWIAIKQYLDSAECKYSAYITEGKAEDQKYAIELNKTDLATIKDLNLSNKNIRNITGLENFIYLRTLDLSFNLIENVDELYSIELLKNIDLSYNLIKNKTNKLNLLIERNINLVRKFYNRF